MAVFGTLFNEIYIQRQDANSDRIAMFKVPFTYGPKDKLLARLNQDPSLNRPVSSILPVISAEIVAMSYDSYRKLDTMGFVAGIDDNKDIGKFIWNPVPYNISFQLSIMTKSLEDGYKIIEQIIPMFVPDFTPTVKLIDDPEIILDIPIILTSSPQISDSYEGDYDQARQIVFSLGFTMKAYYFGPVRREHIIKVSEVGFGLNQNSVIATYTVQPGLTANGESTSNAEQSVSYHLIDFEDDYGLIENIERDA